MCRLMRYNLPADFKKPENKVLIDTITVKIPEKIEGYTVGAIDGFTGVYVTAVTIPDTVVEIGDGAFEKSSISSIKFPKNLKKLGDNAFENCKNLGGSIVIPAGVTEIPHSAFEKTAITEVTIPDSVTSIEGVAFIEMQRAYQRQAALPYHRIWDAGLYCFFRRLQQTKPCCPQSHSGFGLHGRVLINKYIPLAVNLFMPRGILEVRRNSMDRTVFDALKAHTLDGVPVSVCASWALWNPQNLADTSIIENNVHRLNGNIVFAALNFGNTKNIIGEWSNFHSASRSIKNLQTVLTGTRYEGAYMTDIIKNTPVQKAADLMAMIRRGEIDVEPHITSFIEEINLLHTDTIELFLFGRDVERLFKKYVMQHPGFTALQKKIKTCQQIDHYSAAHTGFPVKAPAQLGLVVPKNMLW